MKSDNSNVDPRYSIQIPIMIKIKAILTILNRYKVTETDYTMLHYEIRFEALKVKVRSYSSNSQLTENLLKLAYR